MTSYCCLRPHLRFLRFLKHSGKPLGWIGSRVATVLVVIRIHCPVNVLNISGAVKKLLAKGKHKYINEFIILQRTTAIKVQYVNTSLFSFSVPHTNVKMCLLSDTIKSISVHLGRPSKEYEYLWHHTAAYGLIATFKMDRLVWSYHFGRH